MTGEAEMLSQSEADEAYKYVVGVAKHWTELRRQKLLWLVRLAKMLVDA